MSLNRNKFSNWSLFVSRFENIIHSIFVLKRIFPFALGFLLTFASASTISAQEADSISVRTYPYFPACIEQAYMASDSVKLDLGPIEEINWLRNHRTDCEYNSAVTRRLSLRLMELGDAEYGDYGEEIDINKKDLFKESLMWARIAVNEDSTDDINYENLSMAFAAMVTVSSLRGKARLADSVRVFAEKAVELNPDNHRAYHILGRWHYEVSKLSWVLRKLSKIVFRTSPSGSFQLAIDNFNKAIALNNIPVHHYYLGLAYLESGRKEEALERFEYITQLEDNGLYNAGYFIEKATQLLEKHG